MLLSVLLMMMLVSGAHAGFLGQTFSCIVRESQGGGNGEISQEKLSYSSCQESSFQSCQSANGCYFIDQNIGEWCQSEIITNLSNSLTLSSSTLSTSNWVENINNITVGTEVFYCEQRNRSDIAKPNTAPQTTVIPVVRVPSNCQKNMNLLAFDSDGDKVKCRYASGSLSECDSCTPPSVLNLSSSCSLSFSLTNSSAEGSYVVQMIMEDFPRQTIVLTDASGVATTKTTSDFISKTPVQFLLKVVPAVHSCTNGFILPTFLPPTPDHQTQIYGTVDQTLQIPIIAEATHSVITGLLFSGPHAMVKSSAGPGNYTLTWTPSNSDYGWSQPICVIVQANYSGSVYHSDLRCLVVTVNGTTKAVPQTTAAAQTTIQPNVATAPPVTTTAAPPTASTTTPPLTTTTTTAPSPTATTTVSPPTNATVSPPTTTTVSPPTTTTVSPPTTTTVAPPATTTVAPPATTVSPPTTTTVSPPTNATVSPPTTTTVSPTTNATTLPPSVPSYVVVFNARISTTLTITEATLAQFKQKLVELGLPSSITINIRSIDPLTPLY